ncbi:hypothetical protein RFI_20815 [Reticulomyxa filosa]|uniref:Uncharacterized protein n=1 Tax=Reticulomyxa filosa TaxID=46433 RepID=X6MRT5_RETFI|nr:hypothetical protein RFI_20815 [Reticulomyxa filosa]|eukprot:ETO16524.1 hypothetical protein RFI_20815 [Reticulomyxa filosa]
MVDIECCRNLETCLQKAQDINVLSVYDFETEKIFGHYLFDTYPVGTKRRGSGRKEKAKRKIREMEEGSNTRISKSDKIKKGKCAKVFANAKQFEIHPTIRTTKIQDFGWNIFPAIFNFKFFFFFFGARANKNVFIVYVCLKKKKKNFFFFLDKGLKLWMARCHPAHKQQRLEKVYVSRVNAVWLTNSLRMMAKKMLFPSHVNEEWIIKG